MKDDIVRFYGENRWLSNFWKCEAPIFLPGDSKEYPTVEHAYQAAKTFNTTHRAAIAAGDAAFAKRFFKTRKEAIRPDWNQVKLLIMELCLRQKFAVGTELAKKLDATGNCNIIEGNEWHDVYWGQCPLGTGENHLGKLLMKIRDDNRWEGSTCAECGENKVEGGKFVTEHAADCPNKNIQ